MNVAQLLNAGRNPEPAGYNGDWIAEGDEFDRQVPAPSEAVVVIGRRRD